jgi:hypothetical protein
MAPANATKAATALASSDPRGTDHAGELISSLDKTPTAHPQATSKWRSTYKVHPAADVFPMMSDEELAELGEDIKKRGLTSSIVISPDGLLLDGRNRLEAMERAGVAVQQWHTRTFGSGDQVAFIISSNIRRRHLTKQEQADLIVAALKAGQKPPQLEAVSKGGRGKVNPLKQAAIGLAKESKISKATVERALAKSDGKTPAVKPKQYTARPMPKPKSGKPVVGIDAVRQCYLDRCSEPDVNLDAEQEIIIDALLEIAGKRAMQDDDLGNIPAGLDRRRRP